MPDYQDIINLTRPKSERKKMTLEQRAGQFAPFSALVGYSDSIKETGRLVSNKIILSNEEKENINRILYYIYQNKIKDKVKIEYYVPDSKKNGGKYLFITSSIKKIDKNKSIIILEDNTIIPMDNIKKIEID